MEMLNEVRTRVYTKMPPGWLPKSQELSGTSNHWHFLKSIAGTNGSELQIGGAAVQIGGALLRFPFFKA